MLVVVAMPCLDEEAGLEAACRSLGFGPGAERAGVDAVLVLVDNGSSDGTPAAMERIDAGSPPGSVRRVREPLRGFVPARHRGAMEARRIGGERDVSDTEVLLVQADADTTYMPGFLETMARCSRNAGPGALIEGYSEAEPVSGEFAAYRRLEAAVDAAVAGALHGDEFDVVVDDKVAAFRLSDYLEWGGHRREWGRDGDEVLAETTRLHMRGRLLGGRRCRAEAFASTSLRRVLEDPGLAFATAGHPRGPRWRAAWSRAYVGPSTVREFDRPLPPGAETQLVRSRTAHLVGLFRLLPAWMAASLGSAGRERSADLLGSPSAGDGAGFPGMVVDWAMSRSWEDTLAILAADAGALAEEPEP